MDEWLGGVGLMQSIERIAAAGRVAVAGGEDAAGHRHQMGREQHRCAERHFHFRRVTMIEEAVL